MRAALLTLLLPSAAFAGGEVQVHRLLDAWQTEAAAVAVAPLLKTLPDLPAIQAVAGRVKFYQQRYADALDLMRRAYSASAKKPRDYDLVVATHAVTEDFVTHRAGAVVARMQAGPDEVLAPYLLAGLNRAIERLAPRFGVELSAPLTVEVYPSVETFSRVSTLSLKAIRTSGTIALCKFDRLMIISPRVTARGYDWLDTVSHELIHLLISRRSHDTVPVWLHEGLAKYHESGWRKDFGEPLSASAAGLLARALNRNELISFAQMSPSMAYLPSQEATATAFAEVHTAVEFLLDRKGEAAILGLLDGLRKSGGLIDVAFEQVTGADLKSFERAWRRWLKKRPFERRDGSRLAAITFGKNRAAVDDHDPARPDGDAGRYARLGDLLFRRGRRAAAAIEYRRAVQRAGYGYPGLVHRLASCLIATGGLDEAQTILKRAAALGADDPRTHILLGRLALKAKRYDAAMDHYGVANGINPFDPEVHEGMRQAATARQDPALVQREETALKRLYQQPPSKTAAQPPAQAGYLTLTSEPWAEVLLDDRPLRRATPLTDFPLAPGRYRLTLRNSAAGLERSLDLRIEIGQTVTEAVDLRKTK